MKSQQTSMNKPRIIIMRHSERLDFVLRNSNYFRDTPLSKYGKAHAYHTGEFFRSVGLTPNLVYTSPAMRCIQTADAVLAGLELREKLGLKSDLALHEPIRKELPLQSASFYSSAGFHIDLNYQPLLPSNDSRIIFGETRLQYYRRMYFILKRIIRKLMNQSSPSTILIVTHRSGVTLLAAMLNMDSIDDKKEKTPILRYLDYFQRGEVNFLSMIIAEYDASIGQWTFLSDFPQIARTKHIDKIPDQTLHINRLVQYSAHH